MLVVGSCARVLQLDEVLQGDPVVPLVVYLLKNFFTELHHVHRHFEALVKGVTIALSPVGNRVTYERPVRVEMMCSRSFMDFLLLPTGVAT